jgi:DNA-binding LacI/PurR family transcriptional regulator
MSGTFSVDVDNVGVGRAAAKHLIDLGHRELLCIAPPEDLTYGAGRVEGFVQACAEAGIGAESAAVVNAEDSMAGGYKAIENALRSGLRFTGVCASDDSTAYGVVTALREAGLSVPQDVSVIGCNNDYLAGID